MKCRWLLVRDGSQLVVGQEGAVGRHPRGQAELVETGRPPNGMGDGQRMVIQPGTVPPGSLDGHLVGIIVELESEANGTVPGMVEIAPPVAHHGRSVRPTAALAGQCVLRGLCERRLA